jgi:hypothetical protein
MGKVATICAQIENEAVRVKITRGQMMSSHLFDPSCLGEIFRPVPQDTRQTSARIAEKGPGYPEVLLHARHLIPKTVQRLYRRDFKSQESQARRPIMNGNYVAMKPPHYCRRTNGQVTPSQTPA